MPSQAQVCGLAHWLRMRRSKKRTVMPSRAFFVHWNLYASSPRRKSNSSCPVEMEGHPVRKSRQARNLVSANAKHLRLILLPGYCPELNLDELLNQDVKTNALSKRRPWNKQR